MSDEKNVHQFKTMDDLRTIIKEFERSLARPTRNKKPKPSDAIP